MFSRCFGWKDDARPLSLPWVLSVHLLIQCWGEDPPRLLHLRRTKLALLTKSYQDRSIRHEQTWFRRCLGLLGLLALLIKRLGGRIPPDPPLCKRGSVAVLGLSGALLGLSVALLNTFGSLSAPLGPLLGSLGCLLSLSWCPWGLLWTSLCGPLGPRRHEMTTKCPKIGPGGVEETKKASKTDPRKVTFSWPLRGPFLDPLGTPFGSVSCTLGTAKTAISHGTSFKNAACKKSRSRTKKARKSCKNDPRKCAEKCKKRSPKRVPGKRVALACPRGPDRPRSSRKLQSSKVPKFQRVAKVPKTLCKFRYRYGCFSFVMLHKTPPKIIIHKWSL